MVAVGEVLSQAVIIFCSVMQWLFLARALLSWLPISRDGALMRFLYALTEPILSPLRKLLAKSPLGGQGVPFDFSLMLGFIVLYLAQDLLLTLIALLFFS